MKRKCNLAGAMLVGTSKSLAGLVIAAGSMMILNSSAMGSMVPVGEGVAGSTWNATSSNGGNLAFFVTPPNSFSAAMTLANGGSNGEVGAETITTGASPITLSALAITTGGGASGSTGGLSIHLYQMISSVTTATTGYVPSTAVVTTATNTTGDLFGIDGSGVGQGLSFVTNPAPNNTVLEFDLSGPDQVTLAANTLYSFEVWNTSITTSFFWNRSAVAYSGGQAYATGGGNLGASESSTVSRNQLVGGNPRFATLAVYSAPVPEPTSIGLLGLASISLLGRRRNKTA